MPIRGRLIGPGLRLHTGAWVLSAAATVDTRLVQKSLARFTREHRRYAGAQRRVDAIDGQLQAACAHLSACRAALDEAADTLARQLMVDGHRRPNPFAHFGGPSLSRLARMPLADAAHAVHALAASVRRSKAVSQRTSEAAQAADEAARAVERAIVALDTVQVRLRDARGMRDAMATGWHSAFAALRRAAIAAADDGATGLHATLFAAVPRRVGKRNVAGAARRATRRER